MEKILKNIPFSYMWVLRKISGSPKTVLDLGCGDGKLMSIVADKDWEITGVDIYKESLDRARKRNVYKKLIKGDLVQVCRRLVKQGETYDLVFCSQVIEHLSRKKGEELLALAEKLAKKRIYFGTPRGYMRQPDEFIEGNPYQVHMSGWYDEDFRKRGYRVYGVGLKLVWSENGIGRTGNKMLRFISTLISYIMSPLTFYLPFLGSGIIAVKEK